MVVSAPIKALEFTSTASTTTTGPVAFASAIPAGAVIVLSAMSAGPGRTFTPASSAGLTWTEVTAPVSVTAGTAITLAAWVAVVPAGGLTTADTVTVSFSGSATLCASVAFYYTGATLPLSATSSIAATANSATLDLPAVAGVAGGVVVYFGAGGGSTTPLESASPGSIIQTVTPTNGGNTRLFHAASYQSAAAGSVSPQFTYTGAGGRYAGIAAVLAPSAPPVTPPGTVDWIWTGAPTDTTAVIHAKTVGATSCRLAVSTNPDMSGASYVAAQTPDTYGIVRYNVTGLTANTRHYFQVADTPSGGTETRVGTIGTVRTLGTAGSVIASRKVVIGGCVMTNSAERRGLDSAVAWGADWGHFNGDFFYNAGSDLVESVWVGKYNSQLAGMGSSLKAMVSSGAASYELVSDHDSTGTDNGDSNSAWAPVELAAWNKVVPHRAGSGDSTTRDQQWDDGRVSYFMTDIRHVNRSVGTSADNSSKTMLGAAQKARLLDWLANNPAPFKVLITDAPWMGAPDTVDKPDAWWSYSNERGQISAAVAAQDSHFEVWHGDSHLIGYATAAKNAWGNFPVICAAPYANVGGGRNQTTFTEFWSNGGDPSAQYGRITFTDDGTTITRTFVGYDAITDAGRFTFVTAVGGLTAVGAIQLSGVASAKEVATRTASGSIALSGAASAAEREIATAAGALALSGSAGASARYSRTAAGALSLAGAASTAAREFATAAGVVTLAGTADAGSALARTALGAVVLSGTSTAIGREVRSAPGVVTLSGSAIATAAGGSTERTAQGSITLTGAGLGVTRETRTAEGVFLLGGMAASALRETRTAVGVIQLGGRAEWQYPEPEERVSMVCYPAGTDWSCKFDDDTLADMRADPSQAMQLERAEAFAWSLLGSLTAYTIGTCPITVRPCSAGCVPSGGYLTAPVGGGGYAGMPVMRIGQMSPYISGGNWYNACGCSPSDCSCTSLSEVILPGPVGRIVSVSLGGILLDRSAYRVDNGNRLVRLDGETWPGCQNMAAASGAEGAFEVTYYQGAAPNIMTRAAAGALAAEFYASCAGEACRLPLNITSRTVQGESMDFGDGGMEGVADAIPEVAAVVRMYNPNGLKTRPKIASPDARRTRVPTWS